MPRKSAEPQNLPDNPFAPAPADLARRGPADFGLHPTVPAELPQNPASFGLRPTVPGDLAGGPPGGGQAGERGLGQWAWDNKLPLALGGAGLYALYNYLQSRDEDEKERARGPKYAAEKAAINWGRLGKALGVTAGAPAVGALGYEFGKGIAPHVGDALEAGGLDFTAPGGAVPFSEALRSRGDARDWGTSSPAASVEELYGRTPGLTAANERGPVGEAAWSRAAGTVAQLGGAHERPVLRNGRMYTEPVVGPPASSAIEGPPDPAAEAAIAPDVPDRIRAEARGEGPGLMDALAALRDRALAYPWANAAWEHVKANPWAYGAGAAGLGLYGLSSLLSGDDDDEDEDEGKHAADKAASAERMLALRLPGALVGGVIGAARAPSGHRIEGAGRGALVGSSTGFGATTGGLLGLLAARALEREAGLGGRGGDAAALLGLAGGAGLGGYGGHRLMNWAIGAPSWEAEGGHRRGKESTALPGVPSVFTRRMRSA